jgi:Predicted transcriptional regulator
VKNQALRALKRAKPIWKRLQQAWFSTFHVSPFMFMVFQVFHANRNFFIVDQTNQVLTGAPMRLTTKGRFAVTAMIDLALNSGDGPVTLAAINERQKISLSYLEQLFGRTAPLRPGRKRARAGGRLLSGAAGRGHHDCRCRPRCR